MSSNLINKRKKEDPKKVYERLKKHRLNTKTEKLEITGLDTKTKEAFKFLKGLENFTSAIKLKKLIEIWYAKEPVVTISESELKTEVPVLKTVDKNLRDDEFNKIVDELVKYQAQELGQQENRLVSYEDRQFLSFKAALDANREYRYEQVLKAQKFHSYFSVQLIKQVDQDVEAALGKERGVTYFVLISKITSPGKVFYYKDSSLATSLKFYNKIKYSKKQAKDKYSFLSGEWH